MKKLCKWDKELCNREL